MDIFSAGCVFFFVLTKGGHPFGDPSDRQYHIRHHHKCNLDDLSKGTY